MSIESKEFQVESMRNHLLWQSGQIAIYQSPTLNSLSATISDPPKGHVELDSTYIKCGINGKILHQDFIRKVAQVAQEYIAVFSYPPKGSVEEIWIFEASKAAALLIKKAKAILKQVQNGDTVQTLEGYQQAIKCFETALKIEEGQKRAITELSSVILQLKQKFFLLQIQQQALLYLSSEQAAEFNAIIELYRDRDDLFTCLSSYLEGFESSSLEPHLQYLTALLHEHIKKDPIAALPYYLELAENCPEPIRCLKKADRAAFRPA